MSSIKITKEDFNVVNQIAFPVLTSSLVEAIFNIADQAIIGRTSVEGYAAVGVASNLIYILTGTLGILAVAFNILFGKSIGEDNKKESEEIFGTTLTVSILIGILFELFCILFGRPFLANVYGLKDKTLHYAYDYLIIAGWGLGLNMIIFIFSAYFKNLKKTSVSLLATIVSLISNFVIDYTLVFGKFGFPKLGVSGAAIGTVIGLVLYIIVDVYYFYKINFIRYKPLILKKRFIKLVKLYIPLLGQDFVECTLFVMIITAIITRFDVYAVASYNLLESINSIVTLPVFAYAGVTLTLVTQYAAKKDIRSIKKYCFITYVCSFIAVILVGGMFLLFPEITGRAITNDVQLIKSVCTFFKISIPIQIFNISNQIFKYCLQGISKETWVFWYSAIISAFTCMLIFFLSGYCDLGLTGVYIGMAASYLVLGLGYMYKFYLTLKNCIF